MIKGRYVSLISILLFTVIAGVIWHVFLNQHISTPRPLDSTIELTSESTDTEPKADNSPRVFQSEEQIPGTTTFGDSPKVGQGVIEALQADGEARVVIALVDPPSLKEAPDDPATIRREVTRIQDQVLSELDTTEFRLRLRYQTVPALAGVVTESGLAKLVANPKVVKIDLDVGGSGQ